MASSVATPADSSRSSVRFQRLSPASIVIVVGASHGAVGAAGAGSAAGTGSAAAAGAGSAATTSAGTSTSHPAGNTPPR